MIRNDDCHKTYYEAVKKIPLLKPEEERRLAIKWRAGNEKAFKKLIESNLRFVIRVALEHRFFQLQLNDLIQQGNLGLIKAVYDFDPRRGVRLCTFAVHQIRAHIQSHIMKSWSQVHGWASAEQKALFFSSRGGKKNEEPKMLPRLSDVFQWQAEGARPKNTAQYNTRKSRDVSLSSAIPSGDRGETFRFIDWLVESALSPEQNTAAAERKRQLIIFANKGLAKLNKRETYIIKEHLLRHEPKTLTALGKQLGCSRDAARKIELRALKKMKKALAADSAKIKEVL